MPNRDSPETVVLQDDSPPGDSLTSTSQQNSTTLRCEARLAAFLLASGVAAGAIGAHGLRDTLSSYLMGVYEKAVFYQIVSGLGIGITTALGGSGVVSIRCCRAVVKMLFVGSIIFSGSLYLLVLTEKRWLGAITPVGGALIIAAWTALFLGARRDCSS